MAITIINGAGAGGGSNNGTPVVGEAPAGSGTAFTLAHSPIAGSVALYRNGVRQSTSGDYTISGANITLGSSLQAGESLTSDYRY